jgi:predicted O-methyltransferase YrrM
VHKEAGYDIDNASPVSKNIKKTALKMHRFNEHVSKDPRVEVVILPIFDGLSFIRRKDN